jgi:glycosyltransferase involved in cell wall biosynthesis
VRRLRVVYLGHAAVLSGAELGLIELLRAVRDVEPLVLLAEDGPFVAELEADGIPVEIVPLHERVREVRREDVARGATVVAGAEAALYAARLARRLRALDADLVDANTLKAFCYGLVAARLARVPLVWHVHDRIADDYLPRRAVRVLRRAARHGADGVIANSADTLRSLGGLGAPSAVVHEPVDAAAFRRPPRPEDRPFTVVMVGRIAPWKGQDVFLRAFARAFPHGPARAVVVGSPLFGEHEYHRSLVRLRVDLGLEDRVELAGFRDDVSRELASADVLVHASVIPEPFGRVVVEGMAAGLPVVAADAGGPREIVKHDVDGLLYPPGSVPALADALLRIAGEP